jgi:hypothetical protein
MTLVDATVQDYVDWLKKALAKGYAPTYYYDYPMPRMAKAIGNFTMNGECGARAIDIIVCEGVQFTGDQGHNDLFMPGGYPSSVFVPVYNNPEFLQIPGMREFIEIEKMKQNLENNNKREADYARSNMLTSDVREWSKR